jgi:hypothetical protein
LTYLDHHGAAWAAYKAYTQKQIETMCEVTLEDYALACARNNKTWDDKYIREECWRSCAEMLMRQRYCPPEFTTLRPTGFPRSSFERWADAHNL